MKPFRPGPPPAKREELKTYRELGLDRETKSFRARRRLSGGGPRLLIGGEEPARPPLIVTREAYQRTRAEVLRALLLEVRAGLGGASGVGKEEVLDALRPRVERETYDRLARAHHHGPRLDAAFQRLHGRAPTPEERAALPPIAAAPTYADYRGGLLDSLVGSVQRRQAHNPARYQTVWAQLIGPELAQQSQLEKVDQGIAYFRCLNSALSYQLQRRPELPAQLAKALRVPVRLLKVMY
ncbi:MAG: DciA family protein [Verrucomicrobium sp.]|nr:DciA family protein [Verrucomicrobium sp.]